MIEDDDDVDASILRPATKWGLGEIWVELKEFLKSCLISDEDDCSDDDSGLYIETTNKVGLNTISRWS